jgi:uncharacterized protein involved in response to NO
MALAYVVLYMVLVAVFAMVGVLDESKARISTALILLVSMGAAAAAYVALGDEGQQKQKAA